MKANDSGFLHKERTVSVGSLQSELHATTNSTSELLGTILDAPIIQNYAGIRTA
jgi:hypothetical protein